MLLMFITDARPQYVQNLHSTSALPRGARNRYRYDKRWIAPGTWLQWRDNGLVGKSILIAYLQGNDGALMSAIAVPVRFGRVISSQTLGRYGVLDVSAEGFGGGRVPLQLTKSTADPVLALDGPRSGHFVLDVPDVRLPDHGDDMNDWQETATSLASLDAFRNASFVYVEQICYLNDSTPIPPTPTGQYIIRSNRSIEVVLHAIAAPRSIPAHKYRIQVDESLLRLAQPTDLQFGHKFSTERIAIECKGRRRHELAYIQLVPDGDTIGPQLRLSVGFRQTAAHRALDFGLPGMAAALAASAGIVPPSAPLWIRILMVTIGSAGIAISTARRRT